MRIVLVLAAALAFASPAAAERIVYESRGAVWSTAPDGSGQRQLVARGSAPALSPDGMRVAFADLVRNGVFVVRADGGGLRRVTTGLDVDPTWSPDGRRLAFARLLPGGTSAIELVSAAGGRVARITSGGFHDLQPAWAPNGLRIAFARTGRARFARPQIATLSPTGRALRLRGQGSQPAWSPDGARLAVTDAAQRIVLVSADGRARMTLTAGTMPAWSPDGSRVAYASGKASPSEQPDIYTIAVDGSGDQRLTSRPPSRAPDWG